MPILLRRRQRWRSIGCKRETQGTEGLDVQQLSWSDDMMLRAEGRQHRS